MDDQPFVTIGIPCLNEEHYIEACIACATGQTYPADKIEVLVADGRSTDRTREILAEISERDPRVQMVDNPGRIQAAGMNEIIRRMRGDVLIRLDAHCEYAGDYIEQCIAALSHSGADNVGGAQRARAKSWFQRALCAAMDSPLGVGGAKYKDPDAEGFVDTVFCGAFRRRVFETAGMFDPGAITNEDAELNQRIIEGGGSVYLSPRIVAHYFPRDSMSRLAKQYYKYGKGRARTLLKHGKLANLRPLIPLAAVLTGAALLVTRSPLLWPAVGIYAAATAAESVRVGSRAGFDTVPLVWAIFPVLHVSHGVGMALGLAQYMANPDWVEPERLEPAS